MKKINKEYVVYIATCNITRKNYIGQTCDYNSRKRNHISAASNSKAKDYDTYFHRAIRKYGKENFTWSILKVYSTQELMDAGEKFFVEKYNSIAPNGYNSVPGGRCNSIKKEYNVKRSQKGELNHQYGKCGKLSPHHKLVMNKTTGMKYDSIRELCLSEFGSIKYVKYISRVCNDPHRHKFRNNEYCFLDENYNEIIKNNIFGDFKVKKIINKETLEIYNSIPDASRKLGIPETTIKEKLYRSIKFSKKYSILNSLEFYQANGETPEKDNTVPSLERGRCND